MFKRYDEDIVCTKCKNIFVKRMVRYPGSVDEWREPYYTCPHCGETYNIKLDSREDAETFEK